MLGYINTSPSGQSTSAWRLPRQPASPISSSDRGPSILLQVAGADAVPRASGGQPPACTPIRPGPDGTTASMPREPVEQERRDRVRPQVEQLAGLDVLRPRDLGRPLPSVSRSGPTRRYRSRQIS